MWFNIEMKWSVWGNQITSQRHKSDVNIMMLLGHRKIFDFQNLILSDKLNFNRYGN